VIFPTSVATWVQYYLSVRAADDSPAPWYWYGGLLSALLNFPAHVYSAPAQALFKFGIRFGKLWIEPRIVTFFLLVFVFWYWVGTGIESLVASKAAPCSGKNNRVRQVLYALGTALWVLIALGTAYELASVVDVARHSGWHIYRAQEVLDVTQFLWSVVLAVYFSSRLVHETRVRATA